MKIWEYLAPSLYVCVHTCADAHMGMCACGDQKTTLSFLGYHALLVCFQDKVSHWPAAESIGLDSQEGALGIHLCPFPPIGILRRCHHTWACLDVLLFNSDSKDGTRVLVLLRPGFHWWTVTLALPAFNTLYASQSTLNTGPPWRRAYMIEVAPHCPSFSCIGLSSWTQDKGKLFYSLLEEWSQSLLPFLYVLWLKWAGHLWGKYECHLCVWCKVTSGEDRRIIAEERVAIARAPKSWVMSYSIPPLPPGPRVSKSWA